MARFSIGPTYFRHGESYWRITTGEESQTTASQPKSLIVNVRLERVPWRRYWWETLKRRLRA